MGMAGLPAMLRADDKKDNPYGGFTLGVQSYSLREFDTEQALKRIQDLGLHFVEFYQKHAPLDSTEAQVKALVKLCGDYGIKPIAYGVQSFTKNHDANKKVFEFGKELCCGLRAIFRFLGGAAQHQFANRRRRSRVLHGRSIERLV